MGTTHHPQAGAAGATGRAAAMTRGAGLLEGLGIIGFGEVEAVVIAALASELPMLLVGSHGTGKSLLLTRVAEALGLSWRHYNASLLSYDDLVGYPVLDGRGGLEYAQTPATIWKAEAVFLDEINRCRPSIQNKLFPIIHERKVQGLDLPDLRFRWSAMNPVPADDDPPGIAGSADAQGASGVRGDAGYTGAEPLDAALADRFPFIVPVPDWRGLSAADQERLLLADLGTRDAAAEARLRSAVEGARARYVGALAVPDTSVAVYVRTVLRCLDEAGLECSPRRGASLVRSILAIRATGLVAPDDAALLAVRNGLPQRASGGTIEEHKVVAAHCEGLGASRAAPDSPVHALLAIPNRFERMLTALETPALEQVLRSTAVADGYADLANGTREAVAVYAFDAGLADGLLGAVAAQLAEAYAMVSTPQGVHEMLGTRTPRHEAWLEITRRVSGWRPSTESAYLENLLVGLWGAQRIGSTRDVRQAIAGWRTTRLRLKKRAGVLAVAA